MCCAAVQEPDPSPHRGDAAAEPAAGRAEGPVTRGRGDPVPPRAGGQRQVERRAQGHR